MVHDESHKDERTDEKVVDEDPSKILDNKVTEASVLAHEFV